MIKNISKTSVLLALGMLWADLNAQESITSCGGDASGSGGYVAYSIGQVIYTNNNSANGSVAQGVQHAYEIYSVGINETELNIYVNIFPNPTLDNLTLQINDFNNEKLSFELFDTQGKLLMKEQILAKKTHLNTNNLPRASYFVNIINQENQKVHSFKIIKN
jgi:hypothetical protein